MFILFLEFAASGTGYEGKGVPALRSQFLGKLRLSLRTLVKTDCIRLRKQFALALYCPAIGDLL
jgi:hypothetical protein